MIYLNHAATSWPKPDEVCAALVRAVRDLTVSPSRNGHPSSLHSSGMLFEARELAAGLLGAGRSEDVIFTRGTTEGINLILKGWLKPGSRVLVTPMEHNAVMRPLMRLAGEGRISIETLCADPFGRVDLDAARAVSSRGDASLLVVAHASNVNGAVQDLEALRSEFPSVPMLVDAAQTAGVLEIDVDKLGIDFLACSSHKGLLGPTGVGVCYISPMHDVAPLVEGGTGSSSESFEQPKARPDRYEAGTLNLHGIAGLRAALQGLSERGLLGAHKRAMTKALIDGLSDIPRIRLHSPADGSALCCSFTVEGMRPDVVASRLEEEYAILCRQGLHCAPAAHRHLGTAPGGTIRFSSGWGTTDDDVAAAIRAVNEIVMHKA